MRTVNIVSSKDIAVANTVFMYLRIISIVVALVLIVLVSREVYKKSKEIRDKGVLWDIRTLRIYFMKRCLIMTICYFITNLLTQIYNTVCFYITTPFIVVYILPITSIILVFLSYLTILLALIYAIACLYLYRENKIDIDRKIEE